METMSRNPLRLVAPVALVLFTVAVLLVVATSGGSGDGGGGTAANTEKARDLGPAERRERRQARKSGKLPQGVYVVKTGDTLGSIAEKTGVPVDKLLELNPELDPQSLTSGQRIKLRE